MFLKKATTPALPYHKILCWKTWETEIAYKLCMKNLQKNIKLENFRNRNVIITLLHETNDINE